jgi:Holliday junction resolvase RusA-like endonuclease
MRFTIPFAGKPKARPRVKEGSPTYMPKDYVEWKDRVAEFVGYSGLRKRAMSGDVRVVMVFGPDSIEVEIEPSMTERPKGVRGDLDNLAGGLLDALQDAGLLPNDRHVVDLEASFPRQSESA